VLCDASLARMRKDKAEVCGGSCARWNGGRRSEKRAARSAFLVQRGRSRACAFTGNSALAT
jgi:hypothetical protein